MAKTDPAKKKANKKRALKKATRKVTKISADIFYGDVMSSNFFSRNKFTILIVVSLFMLYITFKYECQTHMERIARLETELSIVKSESIRERSTYKSRTRESTMQHCIDSIGLRLRPQDQPPYILTYE